MELGIWIVEVSTILKILGNVILNDVAILFTVVVMVIV
jgi:hypothetical protein